MMTFNRLFSPGKIGTMELRNRIVMLPMGVSHCTDEGYVTSADISYYGARAKGGAALISTECCAVSPEGLPIERTFCIYDDSYIPGLKSISEAVHKNGAKMSCQLIHAGNQMSPFRMEKHAAVGASERRCAATNVPVRSLETNEVWELIEKFVSAAARVAEAGSDAVELHGAHGYIFYQFQSPLSNDRTDEFGGSFENRLKLSREVVKGVKKKLGNGFPVIWRISGDDLLTGGLGVEENIRIARVLQECGVDCFSVSAGTYDSFIHVVPPMELDMGCLVPLAAEFKKYLDVPVITAGRIRTPEAAESILEKGRADLIGLGRTLLADPDWPRKAKCGKSGDIIPCVSCNQRCVDNVVAFRKFGQCTVNPFVGKENRRIASTRNSKRIFVIGGGPAGVNAALRLTEKGHKVELFERNAYIGGNMVLASRTPKRSDWKLYIGYLERALSAGKVKVHMNFDMTPDFISKERPEVVVLASGSSPKVPGRIKGIDKGHVTRFDKVLMGDVQIRNAKVAVIGGGEIGCFTADYLAHHDNEVALIKRGGEAGKDVSLMSKFLLFERFKEKGVSVHENTLTVEIGDSSVLLENEDREMEIGVDWVVLATGMASNNGYFREINRTVAECYLIGDAVYPRGAFEAITEAHILSNWV